MKLKADRLKRLEKHSAEKGIIPADWNWYVLQHWVCEDLPW